MQICSVCFCSCKLTGEIGFEEFLNFKCSFCKKKLRKKRDFNRNCILNFHFHIFRDAFLSKLTK